MVVDFLYVYLNGVKSSSESLTPKVGNALSIIDCYEPNYLSIFRCKFDSKDNILLF